MSDDSSRATAAAAKAALRSRLLAARAARTDDDRTAAALAIAEAGRGYAVRPRGLRVVAAYLSVGAEPATGPLLDLLSGAGVPLMVPVLLEGGDLDWTPYQPGDPVSAGLRRTLQPAGPLLGVDALGAADLVIVPALAVDRRGHRLGRGGGSYDRALVRVREGVPVLGVVYDDEALDEIPVQAHDRRVDGVLTPGGLAIFASDPPS